MRSSVWLCNWRRSFTVCARLHNFGVLASEILWPQFDCGDIIMLKIPRNHRTELRRSSAITEPICTYFEVWKLILFCWEWALEPWQPAADIHCISRQICARLFSISIGRLIWCKVKKVQDGQLSPCLTSTCVSTLSKAKHPQSTYTKPPNSDSLASLELYSVRMDCHRYTGMDGFNRCVSETQVISSVQLQSTK